MSDNISYIHIQSDLHNDADIRMYEKIIPYKGRNVLVIQNKPSFNYNCIENKIIVEERGFSISVPGFITSTMRINSKLRISGIDEVKDVLDRNELEKIIEANDFQGPISFW